MQGILRMRKESTVSNCSVETQGRLHGFQGKIQELFNTLQNCAGPYGAHGVKEMFLVQKQKITV